MATLGVGQAAFTVLEGDAVAPIGKGAALTDQRKGLAGLRGERGSGNLGVSVRYQSRKSRA
jgi:hypothetical protein